MTSIDVSDHEILVGCADGRARRYDLRNGQLLTDFVGAQITGVAFTRDGQCLLVGTSDDALRLFASRDINTLASLANFANRIKNGDRATYLVNRYINVQAQSASSL